MLDSPRPWYPLQRSTDVSAARWLGVTSLLFLCGVFALPHDLALAGLFRAGFCPGGIEDVLERSETFAHGIGITAIFIVLVLSDPRRRWAFPRAILAVVSAGLAANAFKLLVSRYRPRAADLTMDFTDTFTGVLPLFSVGSHERGTPSAHTSAAVCFAIALCWLYPRGRAAFVSLAILAATQRIASGAHFLSDVLWGASVGYFFGRGIVSGWLTGTRFDRYEARRYLERKLPIINPTVPVNPAAIDKRAA